MKALFDTNILIDYFNGLKPAKDEIERFSVKYISIITYIEILVGLDDESIIANVKDFLGVENRWVLGLWMMGCFPCGGIHRRPVQSSLNNSLEFDVLDNYF